MVIFWWLRVHTTIWMHHKAYWEKATRELHKNETSCTEQILEATAHKAATTGPPPSHLKTIQLDEQNMWNIAGEVRTISQATFFKWTFRTDVQVLDNQLELIYNCSVRTQHVV